MHLLCNAYWLDTDVLQGCDLPKIKEVTYGFNQNADVLATLPSSPLDNFCASAKHNSSPNTFSIDRAAIISDTGNCGEIIRYIEEDETEKAEEDETDSCNNVCTQSGVGNGKGANCYVFISTQCVQVRGGDLMHRVTPSMHQRARAREWNLATYKRVVAGYERACKQGRPGFCEFTPESIMKHDQFKCLLDNTC